MKEEGDLSSYVDPGVLVVRGREEVLATVGEIAVETMEEYRGDCAIYERLNEELNISAQAQGVKHSAFSDPRKAQLEIARIHFPVCSHPEYHPTQSARGTDGSNHSGRLPPNARYKA